MMKFDKPKPHISALASTGIDAANYAQRACAFVAARGNTGFIIRAFDGEAGAIRTGLPATEPQWIAWTTYLDDKGVPTKFAKARGMTTVPCEWPEDFDLECPTSDRGAVLPRRTRLSKGPEALARIKSLAIAIGAAEPAKAPPESKPFTKTVELLAADVAAQPVALSDQAKGIFARDANLS